MLENTLQELQSLIVSVPVRMASIPSNMVSVRPAVNKWSKKEILGHLCDSAINNISRIVKAASAKKMFIVQPYEQDEWVKNNNYREQPLNDIIELWKSLNKQFIAAASNIPAKKLALKCDIEGHEIQTLQWLVDDYLSHMKHHLEQIFNE